MAKRTTKKTTKPVRPQLGDGVEILNAGSVLEDPITSTLETNYMPYAMSVIVSRALPEIDGFKPAHRKLLYTMYGMGLLKGARTKSANIVGSTMHLNPHGDAAIYDTMVRMGRGNESLLVPFVDSKGNFGKAYSRDMSCAAARYTEAKLEGVCEELFRDIDKETVDFVPNYDGTTTEPTLLPVTLWNWRTCSKSFSLELCATNAVTAKRSLWRAATSSACVPMEPVEPNIANFRIFASVFRISHAYFSRIYRFKAPACSNTSQSG